MSELKEAIVGVIDPQQASSLSVLVDLEARWENLKKHKSADPEVRFTLQELQSKQKAYEAFRAKLVAYNKRFKPAHVPEVLLNTPFRLGAWCRAMCDLYRQVENDANMQCPVHLLEKAYRWADLLAARTHSHLLIRVAPPSNIKSAIRDLEALGHWCDNLAMGVSA